MLSKILKSLLQHHSSKALLLWRFGGCLTAIGGIALLQLLLRQESSQPLWAAAETEACLLEWEEGRGCEELFKLGANVKH